MFTEYDDQPSSPVKNKIDVELVYLKSVSNGFLVAEDEGEKPFELHRHSAKLVNQNPPYATFRMSERRAIEGGLA